ncbi:MAG: hypothetical protein ACR2KE_04605 [Candidatus Nanopelagicales bacterium]
MRITTKIVSIAASAALIAGAGAMAAAPAGAAGKLPQPQGSTVITVPIALITAATGAGVTIAPIEPAAADATMENVAIDFPVTGPNADGAVYHLGGLGITSAKTSVNLTWSKPTIEWPTSGDGKSAIIKGVIAGVPAGSGFEALNGQNATLFDVKNMVIKDTKGKIVKNGKKGFKRTDTQTITGDVSVVDNKTVVDILNGLLGVPLFTAAMPFGSLESVSTVTHICKTKKACS